MNLAVRTNFQSLMPSKLKAKEVNKNSEFVSRENISHSYAFSDALHNKLLIKHNPITFKAKTSEVSENDNERLNELRSLIIKPLSYDPMKPFFPILEDVPRVPLEPMINELKEINILNLAVAKILESIPENNRKAQPIPIEKANTQTYIFDNFGRGKQHKDCHVAAEAIIDFNCKHRGQWVSWQYLDAVSFPEALATMLHELTHRNGEDSSSSFSYALTDVLQDNLNLQINKPEVADYLRDLQTLWIESHKKIKKPSC